MKLTEHFALSEFEHSENAKRYKIDNSVPERLVPTIRNLCELVLEPLRQYVGEPIIISSGYRCPKLNKLVGGVTNSQHTTGQAADIYIASTSKLRQCFFWMIGNVPFDQLIMEKRGKKNWVHVSCRMDLNQNRHKVFKLEKK